MRMGLTNWTIFIIFDIPTINPVTGIRSGKRGTRKDQLAKYMSGALTYDATLEVAQEKEVAE